MSWFHACGLRAPWKAGARRCTLLRRLWRSAFNNGLMAVPIRRNWFDGPSLVSCPVVQVASRQPWAAGIGSCFGRGGGRCRRGPPGRAQVLFGFGGYVVRQAALVDAEAASIAADDPRVPGSFRNGAWRSDLARTACGRPSGQIRLKVFSLCVTIGSWPSQAGLS